MKGDGATPCKDRGWRTQHGGQKYVPVLQICSRMKGHLDQQLNKAALEGDDIQSFTLELLQSTCGQTSKVTTRKALVRRIGDDDYLHEKEVCKDS